MKLHCKRIMAMLLALVMVLTVFPTMAFAEGETEDDVVEENPGVDLPHEDVDSDLYYSLPIQFV